MAFTLPQFGIFAQGTDAHQFLEFDLRPGVTPTDAVASFRRLRAPEVSAGGVNIVAGFGAAAWREVAPSEAPASLADITPTVLALFGITTPSGPGRGRVLSELITRDGSTAQTSRRTMETRVGAYSSMIVISSVSGHDYVDSASRRR
jgi:hypothetical protein